MEVYISKRNSKIFNFWSAYWVDTQGLIVRLFLEKGKGYDLPNHVVLQEIQKEFADHIVSLSHTHTKSKNVIPNDGLQNKKALKVCATRANPHVHDALHKPVLK